MAFHKGRPKPPNSGRKKGSLNKKTAAIFEVLEANQFNPIQKLIDIYNQAVTSGEPAQTAIECIKAMLPYVYPKLGETNINVDVNLIQQIEELSKQPRPYLLQMFKKEIKELEAHEPELKSLDSLPST